MTDEAKPQPLIKRLWEEATGLTFPRSGKFTAGEYDHHIKKFVELILEEVADAVCASDPSNKLILHEPYRTVLGNIEDRFNDED